MRKVAINMLRNWRTKRRSWGSRVLHSPTMPQWPIRYEPNQLPGRETTRPVYDSHLRPPRPRGHVPGVVGSRRSIYHNTR